MTATQSDSWQFAPRSPNPERANLLDLRAWNEAVAGESGFVRLSPDGNCLLRGDGRPIRFWAANVGKPANFERQALREHLRWLASIGCNMIRWNWMDLPSSEPGAQLTDVDEQEVEDMIWAVNEARKHGMYSYFVTIGCLTAFEDIDLADWGIEWHEGPCGAFRDGRPKAYGLFFTEQKLREGYKAWLAELLGRANPETGMPLARDPALAIVQFPSEDSLLFYTFNKIPEPQLRKLAVRFAAWLEQKYGSLQAAEAAWGGAALWDERPPLEDDFAHGLVGFASIANATHPTVTRLSENRRARMADQVAFLVHAMCDFYRDIIRFLRTDLGCGQLIMTGNWRPADRALMLDAERWTQVAGDINGKNFFLHADIRQGEEQRDESGTPNYEGQQVVYADRSAMDMVSPPGEIPWVIKHVEGRPFFLSATTYYPPNDCQFEAAFMVAAYGSLSGLDGVSWESFYFDKHLRDSPQVTHSPAQPNLAWTYPAAALIYRSGYVREGEVALRERRGFESIWRSEPPAFAEFPGPASGTAGILPFFVGPVRCHYEPFSLPAVKDYEPYIDKAEGVIRSNTGELTLRHRDRLCTIDAPKAQAACGELARHSPIALSDIRIESRNELAAVYVVSLDGRSIGSSERLLVQVNAPAHPTGWQTEPAEAEDGHQRLRRLISQGELPWRVQNTKVAVWIANTILQRALLLDAGGREQKAIAFARQDGGLRTELPPDTLWVLLQA